MTTETRLEQGIDEVTGLPKAAPAAELPPRIFIFCPAEPEKLVMFGGRTHRFKNGRLDSRLDNLSDAAIMYFDQRMRADLAAKRDLEYIVWRYEIQDPRLQGMLLGPVTRAIAKGAAALGGIEDIARAELRVSMMLADPDSATGIQRLTLDDKNRAYLLSLPKAPVAAGGVPGQATGILPDPFRDTGLPMQEPPRATAETQAAEMRTIQEAAAANPPADQTTPGAPLATPFG